MKRKYKILAKNSFWTLLGNAGSKMLGFLLLPLYTSWLGTSGFGESDLVTTYSSFLVCIMTMCVGDAIFVFTKNQNDAEKKSYFSTSLFFITVVLGIWVIIWGFLDIFFEMNNVKNSFSVNLWYIYFIVITTFLQTFTQQFILSIEKIRIYSLTGIVHTVVTFVFSCLLIPSLGVRGYILSMIIANLLTGCYSFFFSQSYRYLSSKIEWHRVGNILKYSIPLIPNTIMWWLVSALNRPIMEHHLSYSDIGIFAVANRFPGVITMVFSVFSAAWSISVFEEYEKDDYENFYVGVFKTLFFSISIIASFILIFSKQIIMIFAAPEFLGAWKYMLVLIIASVFSCMSGFFGTNFGVVKKSKYYFYLSVWGAGTAIVFNFILIPLLGLWGTSLSVLISFVIIMITRYIYSLQFVSVSLAGPILRNILFLGVIALLSFYIDDLMFKLIVSLFIIALYAWGERELIRKIILQILKTE